MVWTGIEPVPPALGGWSLSLWTTREVPESVFWPALLEPPRIGLLGKLVPAWHWQQDSAVRSWAEFLCPDDPPRLWSSLRLTLFLFSYILPVLKGGGWGGPVFIIIYLLQMLCNSQMNLLEQKFSTGVVLLTRGHLAVSGDVCGCHDRGSRVAVSRCQGCC